MTARNFITQPGSQFIPEGTGAVERTVESKLQDVVSVLDFIPESEHAAIKAKTSTYDATSAIQAALNSAAKVLFSSGKYIVTATLSVPNTVTIIEGEDLDTWVISQTPSSDYLFELTSGSTKFNQIRLFGGDLTDIGGSEPAPTARHGIDATCPGVWGGLTNVYIYGFDIGAYYHEPSALSYMYRFESVHCSKCTTGFWIGQGVHQVAWTNCTFRANISYGCRLDPGSGGEIISHSFDACVFEFTSSGPGLYLVNTSCATLNGCYFEGNSANSLVITVNNGKSQGIVVAGCYFQPGVYPAAHGISVNNSVESVTIDNNWFRVYNNGYGIFAQYPRPSVLIGSNSFEQSANKVRLEKNCSEIQDAVYVSNKLVRYGYQTDSSGNLADSSIAKLYIANATAKLYLKETVNRWGSTTGTGIYDSEVYWIYATQSGGAVTMSSRPSGTFAITFGLNSQTTPGSGFVADLSASVSGGPGNTYYSFITEEVGALDSNIGGID